MIALIGVILIVLPFALLIVWAVDDDLESAIIGIFVSIAVLASIRTGVYLLHLAGVI